MIGQKAGRNVSSELTKELRNATNSNGDALDEGPDESAWSASHESSDCDHPNGWQQHQNVGAYRLRPLRVEDRLLEQRRRCFVPPVETGGFRVLQIRTSRQYARLGWLNNLALAPRMVSQSNSSLTTRNRERGVNKRNVYG